MNKDLDTQLREIHEEQWNACLLSLPGKYADILKNRTKFLVDIYGAFQEAGYVQVVDNPHGIGHVHIADFPHGELSKPMTGAEWLDLYNETFKKLIEYEYGPELEPPSIPTWLVHEAAQRAAGIDT
jgi:hypothetical protein